MNNTGWKKVFSFTFVQYVKTKSFIIGTAVMVVIILLLVAGLNIIPAMLNKEESISGDNSSQSDSITSLSAVYLIDDADLLTDEDSTAITSAGVKLTASDKNMTDLIDTLAASEGKEALVYISPIMSEKLVSGYSVKTYYAPKCDSDAVDAVTSLFSQAVTARNVMNLGVSAEDFAASQRYVQSSKITAGQDEWNIFESMINYVVPMVVSLLLFIMIFAYGQTIAQSIATEKTSRVMELLLTSVRPLAIVQGKVLAMGLVSILQFIIIGITGGVGFLISAPFGIGGQLMDMMSNAEMQIGENAEIVEAFSNSFGKINALTFIAIFVIFVLGFLFFALIAALVGASISRMEDLTAAMQPYAMIGVLGFYLAYMPVIFNLDSVDTGAAAQNGVQIFSYFFPVSSPFSLPSALLLGTLSTVEVIIAIVILAAFVALLAMIVAKVYEMIILHNGSRIKFSAMLKMAFNKK